MAMASRRMFSTRSTLDKRIFTTNGTRIQTRTHTFTAREYWGQGTTFRGSVQLFGPIEGQNEALVRTNRRNRMKRGSCAYARTPRVRLVKDYDKV